MAASSTLSVRNWRTSRPRLAPIAARTATSRSRTVARASSRLATFVHVMTSRNAAAPNSANSAGRKKPTTSVASGTARAEYSPLVDGCSAPRRLVSARSSAFAASGVMPGLSRKIDSMKCAPRLCCATSHVMRCHTSVSFGYWKPGGITPTTVKSGPLSAIVLPTIAGSPPNRSRHSRWLMMAIVSRE